MYIEILRSRNKQFFFRIKHRNRRILATSETYKRKATCMRIAMNIKFGYIKEIKDRT